MRRFTQLFRDHAAYIRTRDEIARMPDCVARDLGIDRSRAAQYASRAVYGA